MALNWNRFYIKENEMAKAKTKELKIFQIKISLRDTDVWRRVLVRSDILLPELHRIIQTAMGWTNSHLHQFVVNDIFYREPEEDDYDDFVDYAEVKLEDVADVIGEKIIYEYDFGDGWEHDIKIEELLPIEDGKYYPVCLAGEKACPPEDCGGAYGYEDILTALKDKDNPEWEELLEWLGDEYDPEHFIIKEVNEQLKEENFGCITLME
jgi:Plasmid pRiA4b ORF-3-like protein